MKVCFQYCFLWLFSALSFAHVSAQKVTVSPELLLRDDYSYTLLGEVDSKVLLMRNKGYNQALSIYDKGLAFIQEIPLEFEERKINLIGFVTSPHDFNTYYSFKEDGNEYIKSVKMSGAGQIFYEDTVHVRENAFISEYYKFDGSDNDRYVALFTPTDDNILQIILYDNQEMETIYETNLEVDGVSVRKDFRKIKISSDGQVSILFEKYNSIYRKEAHHFRLINIDREGLILDQQIDMDGKYTNDVDLLWNENLKQFSFIGLYADRFENISNGYFIFKNTSIEFFPFSDEMISDASVRTRKNMEGLQDYQLNDIISRKDGGYIVVMESNKELYRASNSRNFREGGYRVSVTDYYNEDIIVMSTHGNGEYHWNAILPKKQFSQDDEGAYSSFFIFKTPSKLRFIYNDEIKTNNTVSEYVLNPAGVFERNSVLSTAYQKLKLRIRNAIQVSSNSFLLTSERNNRINIVKIEY